VAVGLLRREGGRGCEGSRGRKRRGGEGGVSGWLGRGARMIESGRGANRRSCPRLFPEQSCGGE
jgi:hypothetical protein